MTRTTSGKNQEDSTWSRIARSATGLAKDVATPNGAYESTHDLSTLRSSHKLSGLNNHNNVSTGERFYKALSSRHQATGLRNSQWTLDATAYDESEDELANFLRGQCSFGNESASSSRSASPLDGPSDGVYDVARVPSHLQWSPQDQRWHTVQSAMTTAQLGDSENSNLKDAQTTGTEIDAQSTARRTAPATPLDLLWDSHFEASRDDSEQDVLGKARPDFKERLQDHERNQQAARRLQLFASHIAVASSKATTSSLTKALQIPALESTYNQLCRGDESQDWAEFLASVEELAQMHHSAQQQPTTKTLQQHNNAYQQHHRIQTPSQQNSQRQEMLQSEETDDLISTFHCPWVGCRQHLKNGYQHMRSSDGKLEGLACVHVGCDSAFVEEGDWREHVLGAHHNVQATRVPTPKLPEDIKAGFESAWQGEFEGDHEFEGSFEDVWRDSGVVSPGEE